MKRVCSVEGCDRPHEAKGYCNAHYLQYWKYGEIKRAEVKERKNHTGCLVEGCPDNHYCRGYCVRHYNQTLKHGEIKFKNRVLSPRKGEMRNMGYIYLLRKDHPCADKDGYVKRANIVWEENTGQTVWPPAIIHHKNGIKNDDRFENLEYMDSPSEHTKLHGGRPPVSVEDIRKEVLRVYALTGDPFTSTRFKEVSTISVTTVVEKCGWNAIKEELCIP